MKTPTTRFHVLALAMALAAAVVPARAAVAPDFSDVPGAYLDARDDTWRTKDGKQILPDDFIGPRNLDQVSRSEALKSAGLNSFSSAVNTLQGIGDLQQRASGLAGSPLFCANVNSCPLPADPAAGKSKPADQKGGKNPPPDPVKAVANGLGGEIGMFQSPDRYAASDAGGRSPESDRPEVGAAEAPAVDGSYTYLKVQEADKKFHKIVSEWKSEQDSSGRSSSHH